MESILTHVIDGAGLFSGGRARLDDEAVERLRRAAQSAGAVGAVFVQRNIRSGLVGPLVNRANRGDADEFHELLHGLHESRLRPLEFRYLLSVVPWFASVGIPQVTATIEGFLAANSQEVQFGFDDHAEKVRLLLADLADRDEFERQGAAMDLQGLVAFVLHEFEQIASANANE